MRMLKLMLEPKIALVLLLVSCACFTVGFLSSRRVVSTQTKQDDIGFLATNAPEPLQKAIVLIVDALRYDFVLGEPPLGASSLQLSSIKKRLEYEPDVSTALKLRVHPPTATHHRLRCLLTGTLPPPLEQGEAIEDSVLKQARSMGMRVNFAGDDTWMTLFPNTSLYNELKPMPSFLVHDLHSCDTGVKSEISNWLDRPHSWDIAFGHFLGVDHAGHTLSATSEDMENKLLEMDFLLDSIFARVKSDASLANGTLVLVLGDHGQTLNGDHGGGSDAEVDSVLFAYAPKLCSDCQRSSVKMPRSSEHHQQHVHTEPHASVEQIETMKQVNGPDFESDTEQKKESSDVEKVMSDIDIAPSLAFLLGFPLPYGSIGAASEQLLHLSPGFYQNPFMIQWALEINAKHALSALRRHGLPSAPLEAVLAANTSVASSKHVLHQAAQIALAEWASFKPLYMLSGLFLLIAVVLGFCLGSIKALHTHQEQRYCIVTQLLFSIVVIARFAALQSNSFILEEYRIVTFLLGSLCIGATFCCNMTFTIDTAALVGAIGCLSHFSEMPKGEPRFGPLAPFYAVGLLAIVLHASFDKRYRYLGYASLVPVLLCYVIDEAGLNRDPLSFKPSIILPQCVYITAASTALAFISQSTTSAERKSGIAYAITIAASVLLGTDGPLALAIMWLIASVLLPRWLRSLQCRVCVQHRHLLSGQMLHLLAMQSFFATGHWSAFDGLQYARAFVGFEHYNFYTQGFMLLLNTFASHLVASLLASAVSSDQAYMGSCVTGLCASMVCAAVQRRHLMVWGVFAPKLAFEAAGVLLAAIIRNL